VSLLNATPLGLPWENEAPRRRIPFVHTIGRFCRTKPLAAFGLIVLLILVAFGLLAPLIAPYDPISNNTSATLVSPSTSHLFGTDQYGRDMFSRIIYGARTSLSISLAAGLLSATVATVLGIVSAYYGRWVDFVLQRVVDTFLAIPAIVLLISVMVTFGVTVTNIIWALSIPIAIGMVRIIRSSALAISGRDYIGAARSVGASGPWIMLRHVLPNVFPTTLVLLTINFGTIIIAEATLSFLGLGIKPPTPAWGAMLSAEGLVYMYSAWWLLVFPAVALSLAVFAINVFGDGLRDWVDPRRRGAS
jgi:peptide/nickel transport system permease protein